MQARFRISEDDYVQASRLYAAMNTKRWTIVAAVVLPVLLLAAFGTFPLRGAAIGGLVGGTVVGLLAHFLITPLMARRNYRNYKTIQGEFNVELQDDGVRYSSSTGTGLVTWDKLLRWRENDRYILLYPMPRLYYIIPRSVADQGFELARLTDLLRRHVGPPF